ncbi:MAG: hypothetical protein IKD88_00825 [Lachnospiraceae bacterium]|nr:hypothetical protein [Lachnospiraceae bacterium]
MKHSMNRTQLKYLAVLAMIVDHIGVFLLSAYAPGTGAAAGIAGGGIAGMTALYVICRVFGRLTAPFMCFFLAEGFQKTSSYRKYVLRLLAFAVISQAPYALAHHGAAILEAGISGASVLSMYLIPDINMLATLLISFLVLLAYEHFRFSPLRWVLIILLVLASIPCDWGVFCPLFVLCFHIFRADRRKQLRSFAIVAAILVVLNIGFLASKGSPWYAELWQLGMFAFIPLIGLYDGTLGVAKAPKPAAPSAAGAEPGPLSAFAGKWFFYIIYPAHLLVFFLIRLGLGIL